MNSVRRLLLQAGLAAAVPARAGPAGGQPSAAASLKAATGPGWADWRGATPALALPDLAGRVRTLREFHGQVVIVNFWASWCEPCREEIPAMSALAHRHRGEGLQLLAVNNAESRRKIDTFLQRWSVDGTVLSDRNGSAVQAWSVAGMPANYLVDKAGALRYWHLGALDWTKPAIEQPVLALLRA
ncbi:TlpA disulfide reductase family protein [Pollutimonas bauzanensis]|uniref:Thiol-disulfide isomerase or thioredoxin n=1 Tax=Pollutimonas bauzanensis TaxID=658167 RepID=A0A1M5VEJ1_9BURK|nr:TlpA disulfide reductase family protein [Pollutimonas bauzanensis]SHH73667.1 Thiol-disulfide isomerase or thioredoxin [Pollutimonas bauzanensis]